MSSGVVTRNTLSSSAPLPSFCSVLFYSHPPRQQLPPRSWNGNHLFDSQDKLVAHISKDLRRDRRKPAWLKRRIKSASKAGRHPSEKSSAGMLSEKSIARQAKKEEKECMGWNLQKTRETNNKPSATSAYPKVLRELKIK